MDNELTQNQEAATSPGFYTNLMEGITPSEVGSDSDRSILHEIQKELTQAQPHIALVLELMNRSGLSVRYSKLLGEIADAEFALAQAISCCNDLPDE